MAFNCKTLFTIAHYYLFIYSDSSPESSYNFQNLPSNVIQRVGYIKPAISNVSKSKNPITHLRTFCPFSPQVITLDVLPKCVFTPSYVKAEPVEHYKGYYKVNDLEQQC